MHPGYGYSPYADPRYWQQPQHAAPAGPPRNTHGHVIRTIGQMSSPLVSRVPVVIEQVFVSGLNTHIPFTYLTDAGVARYADLPSATKLTNAGESALSFPEWTQAKFRFMRLIATNMPQDLERWALHYQHLSDCDLWTEGRWGLSLAYDIHIREACSGTAHDPGRWNDVLFAKLESRFNADTASAVLRDALQLASSSGPARTAPLFPAHTPSAKPALSRVPSTASATIAPAAPAAPKIPGFCFRCGRRNVHGVKSCDEASTHSGDAPLIFGATDLSRPFEDATGAHYCLAANQRGCTFAGPGGCHYLHVCTLCGDPNHKSSFCARAQPYVPRSG
jgi:hypothetical protein